MIKMMLVVDSSKNNVAPITINHVKIMKKVIKITSLNALNERQYYSLILDN